MISKEFCKSHSAKVWDGDLLRKFYGFCKRSHCLHQIFRFNNQDHLPLWLHSDTCFISPLAVYSKTTCFYRTPRNLRNSKSPGTEPSNFNLILMNNSRSYWKLEKCESHYDQQSFENTFESTTIHYYQSIQQSSTRWTFWKNPNDGKKICFFCKVLDELLTSGPVGSLLVSH